MSSVNSWPTFFLWEYHLKILNFYSIKLKKNKNNFFKLKISSGSPKKWLLWFLLWCYLLNWNTDNVFLCWAIITWNHSVRNSCQSLSKRLEKDTAISLATKLTLQNAVRFRDISLSKVVSLIKNNKQNEIKKKNPLDFIWFVLFTQSGTILHQVSTPVPPSSLQSLRNRLHFLYLYMLCTELTLRFR